MHANNKTAVEDCVWIPYLTFAHMLLLLFLGNYVNYDIKYYLNLNLVKCLSRD